MSSVMQSLQKYKLTVASCVLFCYNYFLKILKLKSVVIDIIVWCKRTCEGRQMPLETKYSTLSRYHIGRFNVIFFMYSESVYVIFYNIVG